MVVVVVVGVVALVGAAFGLRGRAGRADRVDGDLSGWQDGLEALSRIDDRHHR
jgi:hypothetical protein